MSIKKLKLVCFCGAQNGKTISAAEHDCAVVSVANSYIYVYNIYIYIYIPGINNRILLRTAFGRFLQHAFNNSLRSVCPLGCRMDVVTCGDFVMGWLWSWLKTPAGRGLHAAKMSESRRSLFLMHVMRT